MPAPISPAYFLCILIPLVRWLKAVIPKKSRPRNRDVKKREPAVVVKPNTASDYEEWIPQHHLKGNSAKKRKGKGNDGKPATPEPLSKRK